MEDNQTNEGQANPPQVPPPPLPIEGNVGNGGSEPPQTPGSSSNSQQPEREPINITVHVENPQNNDAAIANRIAARANRLTAFSIGVNVILMVATFLLFMLTKKATDAAVKSANVADSSLQDQRHINRLAGIEKAEQDIIKEKQRIKDDSTHKAEGIRDSANFELQRASTQAQIDAFAEQSKRFKIENEPILTLGPDTYFNADERNTRL